MTISIHVITFHKQGEKVLFEARITDAREMGAFQAYLTQNKYCVHSVQYNAVEVEETAMEAIDQLRKQREAATKELGDLSNPIQHIRDELDDLLSDLLGSKKKKPLN